jgi:hypothetical protein
VTRPTIQWMKPAEEALDNVPSTDRATVHDGIETWVAHHIEGWARGETKNAGCATHSSSVYGAHVLRTRAGEDVYQVLDLQHVRAESEAVDSEASGGGHAIDAAPG